MENEHSYFWIDLLNLEKDPARRSRLWNGYLGGKLPQRVKAERDPEGGWPQLIVKAPAGGWPVLTGEEKKAIDSLAESRGGHPEFPAEYMDFSGHTFGDAVDFSNLILVRSNFRKANFNKGASFDKARFYDRTVFDGAGFYGFVHFDDARFDAPAAFSGAHFEEGATFLNADFMGGASFTDALFKCNVAFDGSKFQERYFSAGVSVLSLADFKNANFMGGASFRKVLFGNDASAYSRRVWPERRADFTNAEFMGVTVFRKAVFGGAPAFFDATLHEDTDFGDIDWARADTDHIPVDYAIRAWERLELMMSKLEKPLDRHRFYRLKMRVRRRVDPSFLCLLNWLFEKTSDYGWGVGRAFGWWFAHWAISGLALFGSAFVASISCDAAPNWWKLALAALGTSFANAHMFLSLVANGGYLEANRTMLAQNDAWGLLTPIGAVEAVFGPILLFLLLLTLRNRFRLA